MSIRSIERFYLEVKKNQKLKEELNRVKSTIISGKLSPLNAEEFIEKGLIPLAKKYGMTFSLDDLMDYASQEHAKVLEQQKKFLTNDELEAVSGGKSEKVLDVVLFLQSIGID